MENKHSRNFEPGNQSDPTFPNPHIPSQLNHPYWPIALKLPTQMDAHDQMPPMESRRQHQQQQQKSHQFDASKTDLSRRSIDWRDSGIVIDEDNHLFETWNNFDTRSSLNSQCNIPSLSAAVSTTIPACWSAEKLAERDEDGDTILHLAVVGLTLDKVRDLIKLCDLNAMNNMMQTPLHVAVVANRPDMVQLLVDSKALLNVHDRRGNTPLHLASQRGFIEIVEIILSAIASKPQEGLTVQQMIETFNFDGYTNLHLAAIHDKRNIIELLVLKYGASLNFKDSKSGQTIMHKAIRQLNVDLVAFILNFSQEHCNSKDFAGREPLDTIQVLEGAYPKDSNMSDRLERIKEVTEAGIRRCIAKGGCCNELHLTRRMGSMDVSDYSSSSGSDYDSN